MLTQRRNNFSVEKPMGIAPNIFGSSGKRVPGQFAREAAKNLKSPNPCFSAAQTAVSFFGGISEVRGCLEMLEKEGLVTAITVNDGKRLYHLN